MTRDNVLFTVCGLLAGFIAGYFVATGTRPPVPAAPAAVSSGATPSGGGGDAGLQPSPAELAARVKEIQNAIQRDPENVDLQVQLANTYYDASQWKNAADAYEKTLPKKGNDPNLVTDLGSCYRNLGQFDKALEMYRKAQAIQPNHSQSLLNMTLIYVFDLKDAAKAQASFDRLKKEHPEIPRLEDLQMRISALRAARS
jgi:tetratricopeptide (TPR) repeat protein